MKTENEPTIETTDATEVRSGGLSRRDALLKMGGYAAFTAPAVSALLVANKASAQSLAICVQAGPNELNVEVGGGQCP